MATNGSQNKAVAQSAGERPAEFFRCLGAQDAGVKGEMRLEEEEGEGGEGNGEGREGGGRPVQDRGELLPMRRDTDKSRKWIDFRGGYIFGVWCDVVLICGRGKADETVLEQGSRGKRKGRVGWVLGKRDDTTTTT